jgi:hypothetical protein
MLAGMVWSGRLFAISAPVMSSPELPLARRASLDRTSRWASELLDFMTARPKHREQTARSTHVPCANNHEIRLAAAQVLFDFWKPVAISSVDKASA